MAAQIQEHVLETSGLPLMGRNIVGRGFLEVRTIIGNGTDNLDLDWKCCSLIPSSTLKRDMIPSSSIQLDL
jgi:hypothetical protein